MRRRLPGFALVLLALTVAFALRTRTDAHERITTTVTWDREISAIVHARCVECHVDGGRAPMPLTTFAEARPWARAIKHEVLTRRMPIWHAARGFGDFSNDPSLSPFEVALISAWVDGGAPKSLPSAGTTAPVTTAPATPMEPATSDTRAVVVPCGRRPAPRGRLAGLRPNLAKGSSLRVELLLPSGRREVLGWFRNYDPEFAPTYWLRVPVTLPAGSQVLTDVPTNCSVTFNMAKSAG